MHNPGRVNRTTIERVFESVALEILEPRIAPANYFIGSGGEVVDRDGHEIGQAYEAGWASVLGASSAYLFMRGDSLGYDTNGNGKFDKGERIVLSVKSGAAIFFLNALNEGSEIAFVAASDGFGGKLSGVVGDIVTNFGIEDFTHVQEADIRNLTIDGYMREGAGIWAGGEVKGVTITGADPVTKVSASAIVAGFDESGLKIGDIVFNENWLHIDEGMGANVSRIWSAGSIQKIQAGDGGEIFGKIIKGGDGGSISNVVMQAGSGDIELVAGNGYSGYSGKGGVGGSIANITITNLNAASIQLSAGAGESGIPGASDGGSISKIRLAGTDLGNLSIKSGDGGDSGQVAGKGGSINAVTVDITHVGNMEVLSGNGGAGTLGTGGSLFEGNDGGSISNIQVLQKSELKGLTFESVNTVDSVTILAGRGGYAFDGGHAGDGGSLSKVSVPFSLSLNIKAGNGGNTLSFGDGGFSNPNNVFRYGATGIAGAGGDLSQVVAFLKSSPGSSELAEITISAGDAGLGGPASGGNLDTVIVASRVKGAANVEISAGDGSHGAEGSGLVGGDGGNLRKALVFLPEIDRIALLAGSAGSGMATDRKNPAGASGGTGGSLKTAYIFSNNAELVEIKAGNGGNGTQSGYGGDGGEIKDLTLSGLFADSPEPGVFGNVTIWAGKGGSADGPDGAGGNGGNLNKVIGPDFNTYENLDLAAGGGGAGLLKPGKDGKSSNVDIISPSQFLTPIEE